jgi:hypothetical protein
LPAIAPHHASSTSHARRGTRSSTATTCCSSRSTVLLGLPALLDTITSGTAAHAIRLVRYAPLPPEPPLAA